MPVFSEDLTIDQGADFSFTTPPWVVNNVLQDLTGHACRLLVYRHDYDVEAMLSLTGTPGANGNAVANGAEGTVTVDLTNAATAALPATIGPLKYRLFVDAPHAVTEVTVTGGGSGYSTPPTVAFSGGSGAGAAATATVVGGVVTSVEVTDSGTGYTGVPTVALSGGGGTGATATAVTETTQTALLQSGRVFVNGSQGNP